MVLLLLVAALKHFYALLQLWHAPYENCHGQPKCGHAAAVDCNGPITGVSELVYPLQGYKPLAAEI